MENKENIPEREEVNLLETTDANVWAKEFVRINPCIDLDSIRSWFANAIMCGSDHSRWGFLVEITEYREAIKTIHFLGRKDCTCTEITTKVLLKYSTKDEAI